MGHSPRDKREVYQRENVIKQIRSNKKEKIEREREIESIKWRR